MNWVVVPTDWRDMDDAQLLDTISRVHELQAQAVREVQRRHHGEGTRLPQDILRKRHAALRAMQPMIRCVGCETVQEVSNAGPCETLWVRVDPAAGVGLCGDCEDLIDAWEMGARTHQEAEEYRYATRHA